MLRRANSRGLVSRPSARSGQGLSYHRLGRGVVEQNENCVNNGFGAGMMIKEFRPDLVVLDVMLPDINGIEVCRLVRSDKTMDDVRVICISGMVEEDKIQQLRDAGANDFLKKPFDVENLVTHICQLLDVESVPHA